ncbi:hypothetical protein HMPREF1261_00452 [Corynebacterium sp. KPL1818]|uniref:hypothetical protein n=1 Tax=Corynebacterium sp. KPL1818 TaxID=1203559 RepID=UPI0003B81EC3|nr:hypothetical protein [Corynebacterium sp. KPL1818]ERS60788.1 hypothetical protein HMPREF1261_00452 [Corynebacterium sp. KPL1818]
MTTPTPEQLDQATIDLIFALRDSLADDGPSRIDFWGGRATTAIQTAAAGSDNAGQAITTAAHKLQIETLRTAVAKTVKKAAEVIDQDYPAWSAHVDKNIVYIVALAAVENKTRKTTKTTEEIPF